MYKKFICVVVTVFLLATNIVCVSAESEYTATASSAAKITDDIDVYNVKYSNIAKAKNVQTITVGGEYDYYKVTSTNSRYSICYKEGSELKVADNDAQITNGILYVAYTEPCLDIMFIEYFKNNSVVGCVTCDLQCDFEDERKCPLLKNITLNGSTLSGFKSDTNEYEVNAQVGSEYIFGCTLMNSKDIYEISQIKNEVYINVFNSHKSIGSCYKIVLNYDIDNSTALEIETSGECVTGNSINYVIKYGGKDVTSLSNVSVNSSCGVVSDGSIYLTQEGNTTINATFMNRTVAKDIEVSGERIFDSTDYSVNLKDIDRFSTGDIINVSMNMSTIPNETRFKVASSDNNVVQVVGNKIVCMNAGTCTITVTHDNIGTVYNKEIVVKNAVLSSCERVTASFNPKNIKIGEQAILDITSDGAYNTKKSLEIVDGENVVYMYNNVVYGKTLGTATIKITCGDAVTTADIKVSSIDAIEPNDVMLEYSSEISIGKESIIGISYLPLGSYVDINDLKVTCDDTSITLRKIDSRNIGVTPSVVGDFTIKIECTIYNISKEVNIKAVYKQETVEIPVTKILLNKTSVSVEEDASASIVVKTIEPVNASNTAVTFTSRDKNVATVSSTGKITGIKKGTTYIDVVSVSNPEVKASCYVNVYYESDDGYYDDDDDNDSDYRYPVDRVEIRVEEDGKEVSLRNTTYEIMSGTEQEFIAKIYPYNATNQDVRWYSSNENVVEVDEDGMATAYREGEATISVVTRDGNKRASVKITVTEFKQKPTSISIVGVDGGAVNTTVKTGDKAALSVSFQPDITTERNVIWTISEGRDLITVDSTGNVSFNKVGKATIKVYSKDYSVFSTLTFNIEYNDEYWKDIGSSKNIAPGRCILVNFSSPLKIECITNGNVYISTDKNGNNRIDTASMELINNGLTLKVGDVSGGWSDGTTYYIFISGDCVNTSGIKLVKNCRYSFTTRKSRNTNKESTDTSNKEKSTVEEK